MAKLCGRVDLGCVVGERSRGFEVAFSDAAPFRMHRESEVEGLLLLSVESAEGGRRRQLGELLLVHEATPISALRRDKPSRIRVFTVPSGAPTSAAISL